MSDFVQTMKDWRRMCETYSTDDDDCCNGCPVLDYRDHGCSAIFEMDVVDWKKYENAIAKWSAEHPAPVYPTWLEWLKSMGVIPYMMSMVVTRDDEGNFIHGHVDIKENALKPISADIAQKLGIEPKNNI